MLAVAVCDERSSLFGAGNVGVLSRGGRLYRRDVPTAVENGINSGPDLCILSGIRRMGLLTTGISLFRWHSSTQSTTSPPPRHSGL